MNPQSLAQLLGGITGQAIIPQVPGTPGYSLTPPIAQPGTPQTQMREAMGSQMPGMPQATGTMLPPATPLRTPYPATAATQAPASLASLIGGLVRG